MTAHEGPRAGHPLLELNLATEEELERLPGIGPELATAIVASRHGAEGPFYSPMDLVERGLISPHVFHGIHDHVHVAARGAGWGAHVEALRGAPQHLAMAAAGWRHALSTKHGRRTAAIAVGLAMAALPLFLLVTSVGTSSRAAPDDGAASVAAPGEETTAAPTSSPEALVTVPPTTLPIADSPTRYIGNTGGDGVALRDACNDEARIGGAWVEGVEVRVEERGTGSCFTWSKVRHDDQVSWVRNTYLVEEESPVAIVTGKTARLPNPGVSWAQEFCIQYRLGGSHYQVCRTFPTLERAQWTPQDLGTYGNISFERLQYFADCYINRAVVGRPLDRCAFARLGI